MKHAALRAAAHNIADSFSNGISFLIASYDTTSVWRDVDAHPKQQLHFDLFSRVGYPNGCSAQTALIADLFREIMPQQLAREGCDPELVTTFEVTLRKSLLDPIARREVIVTVADKTGRKSTDRYVGSPLRRLEKLDSLGRRRRERTPLKSAREP